MVLHTCTHIHIHCIVNMQYIHDYEIGLYMLSTHSYQSHHAHKYTQLYEQKRKLLEAAHKVELEALKKKVHKK